MQPNSAQYATVRSLNALLCRDEDPDPDNHCTESAILHCGYLLDDESGLYHVRNRMYHPNLGLWMQRDPIGTLTWVAQGSPEYKLRERLREAIAGWVAPARSEGSAEEKIRYIDRILESPCIGQSDLLNKMAARLRQEAMRVERPSVPDELLAYGNGMSLYEYCSGRPLVWGDPTGCGFLSDVWETVKAVADTIVHSPYTIAECLLGTGSIKAGVDARTLQIQHLAEQGCRYSPYTDGPVVQLKAAAGLPLNQTEQKTLEKYQKEHQNCPEKK